MPVAEMDNGLHHDWDVIPAEAVQIQNRLRPRLILDKAPEVVKIIAGVDVSFTRGSKRLYAAVVLLDLSQPVKTKNGKDILRFPILETAVADLEVCFPYIPGLLSFREIPVILKAWEKLTLRPDCLLCDGQGIAHPRRMGLAAHLGLMLDLPSIGCGKSRLTGVYQPPGDGSSSREGKTSGAVSDLMDQGERIGMVLRTRKGVKPVFVSQGHRMTLPRAIQIVLSAQGRCRLPEPIRMAHEKVNEARRKGLL